GVGRGVELTAGLVTVVLPTLDHLALGVADHRDRRVPVRWIDVYPVAAVGVGGTPLLLTELAEDHRGRPFQGVELGDRLVGYRLVTHPQQDIAGCLVVEVGVVDLPRQAARVVPRVGDDPSAGRACGALVVAGVRRDLLVVPGGRKLALTFA